MALIFNGNSIYSVTYNDQDMTSLYYNDNPIWAKKYDDARIYHVSDINSSLISTISYVSSITKHNLERKSSLDPYPTGFSYSNEKAVVHWGDVFRAKGGVSGTIMTLPSGNNIQIDDEREIYLSGEISFAKADAPKIVKDSYRSDETKYHLTLTNFSQFGKTYYNSYWNGSSAWEKTDDFCRCWIQLFKVNYKYSSGSYSIISLEIPKITSYSGATGYSSTIGGWVLSPSDYVSNSNNFSISKNDYDDIFQQRYFNSPSGSSGIPIVWMVRTCYKNGWGDYHYVETFGSTVSALTESAIINGFNNSGLSAVDQAAKDAVNWMTAEPYANT